MMTMTKAKRESWKNQLLAVAGLSAVLTGFYIFLPLPVFIIAAALGVPATAYNLIREVANKKKPYIS